MAQQSKASRSLQCGILIAVGAVFLLRGGVAFFAQVYDSTTKYGSIIHLTGVKAQLAGGGYMGIGAALICGAACIYPGVRRVAIVATLLCAVLTIASFAGMFML